MRIPRAPFERVAELTKSFHKSSWTNEELLEAIEVHQCLVTYFQNRGEPLVAQALRSELSAFESYADARGWKYDENKTWHIKLGSDSRGDTSCHEGTT
jgi:hypothetical protein